MKTALFTLMLLASPAWASAPTITGVEPAELPLAGGPIRLQGTEFAADAAVKVGGYPCSDLTVISPSEATCMAPANIARKSNVAILNADGGTASAEEALEYRGVPGFALLQQRVFVRFGVNAQGVTVVFKCTGCHGGMKPDGNLDIKEYAQVAKRVVAGDPNASLLFTDVRDGKMPPRQRQPELKPEEKQALADWISAGALNN